MTEVVSIILQPLVEKLASLAIEEIQSARLIKNEKEKLEWKLKMIQAGLTNAEKKQTRDEAVELWLLSLKDICYDIRYVLEEFEDRADRELRRQARHSILIRKVRNLYSWMPNFIFQLKMAYKMKELKKKLDEIIEGRSEFDSLTILPGETSAVTSDVVKKDKETCSAVPSDVVGRYDQKERIINFLIGSDDGVAEKIEVASILGMGGIGKTTLAAMVYRDETIKNHFEDNRVWIYMPVEFEVNKMIGIIIESLGCEKKCTRFENLQESLRRIVENKKWLFVMDNVYNVETKDWRDLKDLLGGVSEGSKVLVTSQNQQIPDIMGAGHSTILVGLSPKESLTLFVKCAFGEGQEKNHPDLMEIGEQIVGKCKRNPLALKTLGCSLFSKKDNRSHWEHVRDSEMWLDPHIITPLKISHDLMPSYLKQCFAYCSIFPKSHVFSNLDLIQLWISSGLIQSNRNNQEAEEIGQHYLEELRSRSFIDVVHKDDPMEFFQMHDLIHDLAISVAQTELSNMEVPISPTTRHIRFPNSSRLSKDELCSRLSKLRLSRVCSIMSEEGSAMECFLKMRISRFKQLRVLWLDGSSFDLLPSSIGSLKLLRFLTLRSNRKIKKLPKSVYKLRNLQYLGLGGCTELEKLPANIKNLINLRVLSITTKQQHLPEGGIGCLTSLQWLFIGECENLEALFDDIQSLTSLRKLFIWGCPKLAALPQGIENLEALEDLGIWSCRSFKLSEGPRSSFRLRSFRIERLPEIVSFPSWLEDSASTLWEIRIADCPNLRVLPEWLQHWASLRKLEIINCPVLSSLIDGVPALPY